MPRYIEGEALPLAQSASDDMLLFTALVASLIGLVLIKLGKMGDQLWMRVWGAGLVIASFYLGLATYFQEANPLAFFLD